MSEYIEIHWTSGNLDEARRISRYLVQERYVACAQIIPWIESIFMWDNQLDTVQESKVIFKTRAKMYGKVREVIEQNCSYEIPEITFINIEGGNDSYLNWVNESTTTNLKTAVDEV